MEPTTTTETYVTDFYTESTLDYGEERLDCEHLDEITDRVWEAGRPSFITVIMRFFGNIFVDCFRSIFE